MPIGQGQCRTIYRCTDDRGKVNIPGGKGSGGNHVEDSCVDAESVVNPDGSWGGSICHKKFESWIDEDPDGTSLLEKETRRNSTNVCMIWCKIDPNYAWACPCTDNTKKVRQPLRPGNRQQSTARECNENKPAMDNYKKDCPRLHGVRRTINGVEYEYSCDSTLSPLSINKVPGVYNHRACASFCSDDASCQGFVWNSDTATCHFSTDSFSATIPGTPGSLVLKPTTTRRDNEFCPELDKQRTIVRGEEYEVACSSKLDTVSSKVETGVSSSTECGGLCSVQPTCEGMTWDDAKRSCIIHQADASAKLVPSAGSHALKKTNSPGKQTQAQKDEEQRRKREAEEEERRRKTEVVEEEERQKKKAAEEEEERRKKKAAEEEEERRKKKAAEQKEEEEEQRQKREAEEEERRKKKAAEEEEERQKRKAAEEEEERRKKKAAEEEEERRKKKAAEQKEEEEERRQKREAEEEEERRRKKRAEEKEEEERIKKKRAAEEEEEQKRKKRAEEEEEEQKKKKDAEEEERKKKESESSVGRYRSASSGNFCSGGPSYVSAGDMAGNPNRVLLDISGEQFILYCDTATGWTYPRDVLWTSPWACAEQCAKDTNCLGIGWITNSPHCVYHSFHPSPAYRNGFFKWAPNHNALYKKSESGKVTRCVRGKPGMNGISELAAC
jgi:hypothetical protein